MTRRRPLLADWSNACGSRGPHGDAPPRRSRARHGRQLAGSSCAPPRSTTRGRAASPPRARSRSAATSTRRRYSRNGRVLVLGGSDERDWRGRYRTAEVFDPREGTVLADGLALAGAVQDARCRRRHAVGGRARRRRRAGRGPLPQRPVRARRASSMPRATTRRRRCCGTARCSSSAATTARSHRQRAASSTAPESRRAPRPGRGRRR